MHLVLAIKTDSISSFILIKFGGCLISFWKLVRFFYIQKFDSNISKNVMQKIFTPYNSSTFEISFDFFTAEIYYKYITPVIFFISLQGFF